MVKTPASIEFVVFQVSGDNDIRLAYKVRDILNQEDGATNWGVINQNLWRDQAWLLTDIKSFEEAGERRERASTLFNKLYKKSKVNS